MKPFSSGELRIDACALSSTRFRLDWKGRSASREPGVDLRPYLAELLAEALKSRASVEMHFEALEYFNSSTVSVLVDCVRSACAQKVPVKVFYAADIRWQRLSFDALRVFSLMDQNIAVTPIGVQVKAGPPGLVARG